MANRKPSLKPASSAERVRAYRERRRAAGSRPVTVYLPAASILHMRVLARHFNRPVGIVVGSCITDVWKRVTGNSKI